MKRELGYIYRVPQIILKDPLVDHPWTTVLNYTFHLITTEAIATGINVKNGHPISEQSTRADNVLNSICKYGRLYDWCHKRIDLYLDADVMLYHLRIWSYFALYGELKDNKNQNVLSYLSLLVLKICSCSCFIKIVK